VANLADAQKECLEYSNVPEGEYFIKCYGTAGTKEGPGYALLDDAGKDLDKIMAAGPVSAADPKIIIKGLLTALKTLYDSGKSHRDVKPANVCYKNSKVKLIDFGLMFPWSTDTTVANIDKLERRGRHGTPYYRWPDLVPVMEYKPTDKVSLTTKQAYCDRIRPKMYLVDVGGVWVTHLKLMTRYTSKQVTEKKDIYGWYVFERNRKDLGKDFWKRYDVVDLKEIEVLKALRRMNKTYTQLLALPWFAS